MKNKEYIHQYEKHDIAYLKGHNLKLAELTDLQVKELYREWSTISSCAGWLTLTKSGIREFEEWLFNSPFDLCMRNQK